MTEPQMRPFGIYSTKFARLVYIGLHDDHDAVWSTYLGWPSQEEIQEAMADGMSCVELVVTYKR